MKPNPSTRRRARGFTLIEVMVALLVIAIGFLGIAKMQALALSNTGASRMRALAAIEATSLAAAMHTNRAYWASYSSTTAPGTIAVTTTAGTPTVTSTGATLQAALTAVAGTVCPKSTTFNTNLSCYCAFGNSNPCATSYVNMAASDLYDWSSSLANVLPSATAQVTCVNTDNPIDCTILISWTESALAANSTEAAAIKTNTTNGTSAAIQVVNYTLYVVP